MNYIGSKLKLSEFLTSSITGVVGDRLKNMVFCDLFAGTSRVGRTFKPLVNTVIANDIEHYGFSLGRHYIENNEIQDISMFLEELNSLELVKGGFIWTHYSQEGHGERQYFSDYNAAKIDTIRSAINDWYDIEYITEDIYYHLLSSLLEAADKVANTASTYGAYLKQLKKSAQEEIFLIESKFDICGKNHKMYNESANDLIYKISGDVLYLDPPYNQRQYGAYYHILNTISKAEIFEPKGKTGLPEYSKSAYCRKNEVKIAFEEIIREAKFEYIFLSYNNEGLMSETEIVDILSKYGEYSLVTTQYQRYKADTSRSHTADFSIEYLHILHKDEFKKESSHTKITKSQLGHSIKDLFTAEKDPRKMTSFMLKLTINDWKSIFDNQKLPLHIKAHIKKYFKVTKNKDLINILTTLKDSGYKTPSFEEAFSYLKNI